MFDKLAEGRYTLWVDDEPRAREVAIAGGEIAELDWRTAGPHGTARSGADRRLVFGPNDFDETLPGPWEWDVKRMAASTPGVRPGPRAVGR